MSGPPLGRGGVGAPPSSCAAKPLASVGIGAPPVPQAEAAAERRSRGSPPASGKRIIWAVLGYTELTTMSGPSRVTGGTEGPAASSRAPSGWHPSAAQASSSWRYAVGGWRARASAAASPGKASCCWGSGGGEGRKLSRAASWAGSLVSVMVATVSLPHLAHWPHGHA